MKSINKRRLILFTVLLFIIFCAYNIWRCYSTNFIWGAWQSLGSLQNTVMAVCFFLICNSIQWRINDKAGEILAFVSDLTLGAYLLSWIIDDIKNSALLKEYLGAKLTLKGFVIYSMSTVILSLILSLFIHILEQSILHLFHMTRKLKKAH